VPQPVNLIFQGGGVKGIAFAGALTALEGIPAARQAVSIDAVGGVSVGAITAALYAAGYSAQELSDALKAKPVASLLREAPPFSRFGSAWRLWRRRGLYSTDEIRDWIEGLLAAKNVVKFRDLKKDCRIVAANVTTGEYKTYTRDRNKEDDVVPAVLKSLSIPLFFTPYVDGNVQLFVDGGLLSNNPLWLFADSPLATIGLKLMGKPWHGATIRDGLFDYLKSLVATMLSAHDAAGRGIPPNVVTIPIDVSFASSIDFKVEEQTQDRLFKNGHDAISTFDWATLPATRDVVFNDPHAGEILEATANNIQKLFNRSPTNKRHYQSLEIRQHIDEKGWADMRWHYVVRNGGPGAISMLGYEVGYTAPQEISFKDLAIAVRSRYPHEVLVLPRANTDLGKKFAVAFVPPIAPGETREVWLEYRSPEFPGLAGPTKRDVLGVEIVHEGGIDAASVVVTFPRRFGQLSTSDNRGRTPALAERLDEGDSTGFVWRFQNLAASDPLDLMVDLRLS
jgi:NTE family protein